MWPRTDFSPNPYHYPIVKAFYRLKEGTVVMNGTRRPIGSWRISGLGPFEWIISHRPFLREMGVDVMPSIYTPKRRKPRRKMIPGLDLWSRRYPRHDDDEIDF